MYSPRDASQVRKSSDLYLSPENGERCIICQEKAAAKEIWLSPDRTKDVEVSSPAHKAREVPLRQLPSSNYLVLCLEYLKTGERILTSTLDH